MTDGSDYIEAARVSILAPLLIAPLTPERYLSLLSALLGDLAGDGWITSPSRSGQSS